MGVDSPYVENIIHISPPANIESYMQETGRAGRNGKEACAILYYNKSDISANKVDVEESMKNYCKSENTCFRKIMLNHFGFPNVKQVRCCSRCDKKSVALQLEDVSFKEVFKSFKEEEKLILYHTIEESLTKWQERIPDFGVYTIPSLEKDLTCKIIENIEYIETESNLLHDFGIWDEECASEIFAAIKSRSRITNIYIYITSE